MFKRYQCSYCGDRADARDHVLPQALDVRRGSDCWVPVCRQCNGWLGARPLLTVGSRAEFILEKLREHPLAVAPVWDKHDIDGLEGSMRRYVAAGEILRRCHMERIAWALLVVDLDPCVNEVRCEAGLMPSKRWEAFLQCE